MARKAFRILYRNLRLFLPSLFLALIISGLAMNSQEEVFAVFSILATLILLLLTLFFTRHILAKQKITFRGGLYNAMAPLMSTLAILAVIAIQCVPIIITVIAYTAAIETNLFETTGYLIMFIIFEIGMVALTGYLLSSTLFALIIVSTPGVYPAEAIRLANLLVKKRRMRVLLNELKLFFIVGVIWVIAFAIVALIKILSNNPAALSDVQAAQFCESFLVYISVIYMTIYLFLEYKNLISKEGSSEDCMDGKGGTTKSRQKSAKRGASTIVGNNKTNKSIRRKRLRRER